MGDDINGYRSCIYKESNSLFFYYSFFYLLVLVWSFLLFRSFVLLQSSSYKRNKTGKTSSFTDIRFFSLIYWNHAIHYQLCLFTYECRIRFGIVPTIHYNKHFLRLSNIQRTKYQEKTIRCGNYDCRLRGDYLVELTQLQQMECRNWTQRSYWFRYGLLSTPACFVPQRKHPSLDSFAYIIRKHSKLQIDNRMPSPEFNVRTSIVQRTQSDWTADAI